MDRRLFTITLPVALVVLVLMGTVSRFLSGSGPVSTPAARPLRDSGWIEDEMGCGYVRCVCDPNRRGRRSTLRVRDRRAPRCKKNRWYIRQVCRQLCRSRWA